MDWLGGFYVGGFVATAVIQYLHRDGDAVAASVQAIIWPICLPLWCLRECTNLLDEDTK